MLCCSRLGGIPAPVAVFWVLLAVLALGVSRQAILLGRNLGTTRHLVPSLRSVEQILAKIPLENGKRLATYLQYLDSAYLELTLNWICNVKPFHTVLPRTVFVAFDMQAYEALRKKSLEESLLLVFEPYQPRWSRREKDVQYGHSQYFNLMLYRTRMELMLLEAGVEFFLVESDATWHRDPAPLIFDLPGDVVALNDAMYPGDFMINHGFSSFRPRPRVLEFFRELEGEQGAGQRSGDEGNEQYIMQRLLADKYADLNVTYLDRNLFLNGKMYLSELGTQPLVRHNNFLIGTKAKVERAKDAGFWYLDPKGICHR